MDMLAAVRFRVTAAFVCLLSISPLLAKETEVHKTQLGAADALFSNGVPLQIEIRITQEDFQALKKDSRKYVRATVVDGDMIFTNVGLHLKGSAGSFRQIDDPKPAFTLSFNQFILGPRFHGLRKIHLNNSVQDGSYLNEMLAGELFRGAGVPATRAAHALVEFNGKKLGLYVLKEGFTKDFLARYFKKTNGNLYDMDPGREITEKLKKDMGDGPNDWSDLKALTDAAREPDVAARWARLDKVLDLDRFVSFMVMEIMTCHWDGYCIGRNNFRIYGDRDSNKMVFFPHGTDQMFQNAISPIRPSMQGLLALQIMRTPQGRHQYRERFGTLFTNLFQTSVLTSRVDAVVQQVFPYLSNYDRAMAAEFRSQAEGVKDRISQRAIEIRRQLDVPESKPIAFANAMAKPPDWRPENALNGARLDRTNFEGRAVLHIMTTTNSSASWRSKVLLDGGRYRLQGTARSSNLVPLREDKKGLGAGMRISGSLQARANALFGTQPWTKLEYEFDAAYPDDEIDLICELRAQTGEVWFDLDSLKLIRVK